MAKRCCPCCRDELRAGGEALLARMSAPPPGPRLVHGDLGPEHIRVVGDAVTGVIDWGDCCVGDPALDLAWTRYGAGPAFAAALEAAYRPDETVLARARDWHLLGPWHEVVYGLDTARPDVRRERPRRPGRPPRAAPLSPSTPSCHLPTRRERPLSRVTPLCADSA